MEKRSGLSLITKTELLNFPSASSIEFHNDLLYVIGDDARNLAILNKDYKLLDTVTLFPGDGLRIPKKIKADLEASAIIRHNNKPALLVAGSSSTPEREVLWLFPLDSLQKHETISTSAFIRKLGLKQINFEGLAAVNNLLVFGNRGNNNIPQNQLVIVPLENLTSLETASPIIIELNIAGNGPFEGLSGLAYVPESDLLLFTASVEHTASSYDDGKIGDSYLGYIKRFSTRLNEKVLRADELINLSQIEPEFKNEKIESVAVESAGRELILHLVADNDNGTSTLFKLSFPLPK